MTELVLVDTSVWIEHLQEANAQLSELLSTRSVLVHRAVLGELACGNLHRRKETLSVLKGLRRAQEAEADEALAFIEAHRLHGRGLNWVDVQLLASAALHRAQLWTFDKRLALTAESLALKRRE